MGRNRKVAKEDILNSMPSIKDYMDAEGLTATILVQKLREELEYEEPVLATFDNENKKGKKKKKKVLRYVMTPASMSIRRRGRMEAHRLRNEYPPEEKRTAGRGGGPIPLDTRPINVIFIKAKGKGEDLIR
jgi:hypothetical protein